MPAVLFVCVGNQYRSPVAEAQLSCLLEERGLRGWRVESAGTWAIPGQPVMVSARDAARAVGMDVSGHSTRLVDGSMLAKYDLILVMEQGQKEALGVEFPSVASRTYLLTEMVADGVPYDIPDPILQPGQERPILTEMCEVIERGLPRIIELAKSASEGKP